MPQKCQIKLIKHDHSPEVIVVLDPRYDESYKAMYIDSHSIALKASRIAKFKIMTPKITVFLYDHKNIFLIFYLR